MKIEFVGAPFKNIGTTVQNLLQSSNRVSIAVAFLQKSGVEKIKNCIEECEEKETSIFVITGLNYGFTNPDALRELLYLDISCNIFQDENFHPKLYIFEKNENEATIIIGSSNLSEGGLSKNYEANLIISGNVTESPIKNAIEYFSLLQSKSIPLNEKIIELYSKTKKKIDNLNNTIDDEYEKLKDDLNDYLNQKTSPIELTVQEIKDLVETAMTNSEEGGDCYERGEMTEAYDLYKESCLIYDKLANVNVLIDNEDCLIKKVSNLLNMAWILIQLEAFDEAKNCTDEAEVISKSKGNKKNHLEALGLGAIVRRLTKEGNEKCDAFIKIFENDSEILNDDYNLIGNVYNQSAECKFELKIGDAYKHSLNAIKYFKDSLKISNSKFDSMIAYNNIANAYLFNNEIKPEPDYDIINIRKNYEKALFIAKDELNSNFWEALIRMDFGAFGYISTMESCRNFKKAKKIFENSEYYELINSVDELIKTFECS